MQQKFSKNELILIAHFGYGDVCELINAVPLWQMMVNKAFLSNESGLYVEALQRGWGAIQHRGPYRLTPEFDKLIEVK